MLGSELLAYARTDVLRDAATPYLWSDALILRRLSEAQEFTRADVLDRGRHADDSDCGRYGCIRLGCIHCIRAVCQGVYESRPV